MTGNHPGSPPQTLLFLLAGVLLKLPLCRFPSSRLELHFEAPSSEAGSSARPFSWLYTFSTEADQKKTKTPQKHHFSGNQKVRPGFFLALLIPGAGEETKKTTVGGHGDFPALDDSDPMPTVPRSIFFWPLPTQEVKRAGNGGPTLTETRSISMDEG